MSKDKRMQSLPLLQPHGGVPEAVRTAQSLGLFDLRLQVGVVANIVS